VQSHRAATAHLEAAMLPQHIWELPTNTCSATAHLSPAMQVVCCKLSNAKRVFSVVMKESEYSSNNISPKTEAQIDVRI
jgi:hypothetical protein